jgi:hypothetical protein
VGDAFGAGELPVVLRVCVDPGTANREHVVVRQVPMRPNHVLDVAQRVHSAEIQREEVRFRNAALLAQRRLVGRCLEQFRGRVVREKRRQKAIRASPFVLRDD